MIRCALHHVDSECGRVCIFYLETVDKQQVELSEVISAQKFLLQVPQVGLDVSLHLVKADRCTTFTTHALCCVLTSAAARDKHEQRTPSPVLQQEFGQHRPDHRVVVHTLQEGCELSGPVHVPCITHNKSEQVSWKHHVGS